MTPKNPPGRPTITDEERRDIRKLYRWSQVEHETLTSAADTVEETEATFVRKSVMDRASHVLKRKGKDENNS